MTKIPEIDAEVLTTRQKSWRDIIENTKKLIESGEVNLIINKKVLKMAEEEEKKEE